MPRSVQIDYQMLHLDNEAHVRRVLRACLDSRSEHQVDSIVGQCSEASEQNLQRLDWHTSALTTHSVRVEFRESVALPFSSISISSVIDGWPSLDALGSSKHDRRYILQSRLPQKTTSDGSALDRRIVLRRLVRVRNCTIMLWEDAFNWQTSNDSPPVMVRGSGWSSIVPLPGHEEEWSLVHSGGLFQIHTRD